MICINTTKENLAFLDGKVGDFVYFESDYYVKIKRGIGDGHWAKLEISNEEYPELIKQWTELINQGTE